MAPCPQAWPYASAHLTPCQSRPPGARWRKKAWPPIMPPPPRPRGSVSAEVTCASSACQQGPPRQLPPCFRTSSPSWAALGS
eukprot:scaffold9862_cov118-Isochrysis_galbana.AAC.4